MHSIISSVQNTSLKNWFHATTCSTNHYGQANYHRALEMDGEELLSISPMVIERTLLLAELVRPIHLEAADLMQKIGLFAMALLSIYPALPVHLQLPKTIQSFTKSQWLQPKLHALSLAFQKGIKQSDSVCTIAYTISCIALSILISPVYGLFGGVSLLLVALKRKNYLDPRIHHLVVFISNPLWLLYHLTQPSFWMSRTYEILDSTNRLISSIYKPSWMQNPYYNRHVHSQISAESYKEFKESKDFPFRVEKTYVHANQVAQLLPPEPKRQATVVFAELDARIERLKEGDRVWAEKWEKLSESAIENGREYVSGYEQVKKAALTGKIVDKTPANIKMLQTLLTQMAESILADPNPFFKLEEFERIGKQCSERWAIDMQVLLSPQTGDVGWGVHHTLSKMRGSFLNEEIRKILDSQDHPSPVVFNEVQKMAHLAKAGDTHMLKALHRTYRHWFATYEGVVDSQLHPYTLFGRFAFRYLLTHQRDRDTHVLSKQFFLELFTAHLNHPVLSGAVAILKILSNRLLTHFDHPEALVDRVYWAILERQIIWATTNGESGVQHWIQQFCENTNHEEDSGQFYEEYTETVDGQQCLNRKGVQLLLWDLGILRPTIT